MEVAAVKITCVEELKLNFAGCCKNKRRWFCCLFPCCKKRPTVLSEQENFVVIAAPEYTIPNLSSPVLAKDTDVYTFDAAGVFIGVQGPHLSRWVHSESQACLTESLVLGRSVEVFEDPVQSTMRDIIEHTLKGSRLQLIVVWLGTSFILRTFPLIGKRRVYGGTIILHPGGAQLPPLDELRGVKTKETVHTLEAAWASSSGSGSSE